MYLSLSRGAAGQLVLRGKYKRLWVGRKEIVDPHGLMRTYGQRLPPVVAPAPTQPVFSSQAFALCFEILSASIFA